MNVAPSAQPTRAPWVVRNRIALTWLPALLFLTAIVLVPASADSVGGEVLESIGFVFIMAATMGRIWCAIYIAGRKNKELATDGPYSLCRNPLYLFSYFGVVGLAVGAKSLLLAVVVSPIFWLYYSMVIRSEEKILAEIFGEAFEDYRRKVPAVIPHFSGYWTRDELTIQPRKVLKGMVDAMWFLWAVVLLELLAGAKIFLLNR